MALSLIIGLRTGFFILSVDGPRGYSYAGWLYVAGIGAAIVGLIFLLAKGRFLIDTIGGITLALFGNLVLFTFLSPFVAFCGFTYSYDSDSGNQCFPSPLEIPALSSSGLILFISVLLLLVGTRFFLLRRGNTIGGFIFGACLILAGIVVANIVRTAPLYNDTGLSLALPSIGSVLWLPSVIAGILTILAMLLQRQRNKPRAQR
jgi:hypothetical protein